MIAETPRSRAFLKSRELTDEFADLSAADIERMSFTEYAKRTNRAVNVTATDTQIQQPERHPVIAEYIAKRDATEDSGVITMEDLQGMSLVEYQRVRRHLGMGVGSGEGRGILNQPSSGDLADGVRKHAGRGALSNNNVAMPPRIDINSRLTAENTAPTGRNDGFSFNN